ncbi:MAG TPA: response regulator transcription factor [Actinomycetota bacterium]|nr:response regulator transcription factor [Actinomycetota bacterium]
MLRTLVVDDDESIRRLLTVVLSLNPQIRVVGEAGDGSSAVSLIGELRPDVVILDHAMPGRTGASIVPILKEVLPKADVIFFSAYVGNPDCSCDLSSMAEDYGCYLLSKEEVDRLEILLNELNYRRMN